MKPKLAVGISYFNNVKEIPRLLDPIYKNVDMIIAVDGRYPLFDYPTNVSTDGSTELLIEKYNAVVISNTEPIEQIAKRNQYLDAAAACDMDFLLVLDTDDYLRSDYTDWPRFYKELEALPENENLANMLFWMNPEHEDNWNNVKDNTWNPYVRIIRPKKVQYAVTHYNYVLRDNAEFFIYPDRTIEGLRFDSDSIFRTEEYKKKGYEWAKKQMDEENLRLESPENKRKNFQYWTTALHKALSNPGTEIISGEENIPK
jgi:hypothetical protein